MTEFAMIHNLDGRKLVFMRFHNSDYIVVDENGPSACWRGQFGHRFHYGLSRPSKRLLFRKSDPHLASVKPAGAAHGG